MRASKPLRTTKGMTMHREESKPMRLTCKDVGKQLTFRAATRYAGAPKLTRKIKAVLPSGIAVVRCHGFDDFCIHPHEFLKIEKG